MLLWQGVRKEKCSNDEEADEDEEEEGRLIPQGKKRSQQHKTKSCSKKQKFDNTERKPTIYSYDSLLSHILGEKSAATIFISNLSYAVDTTSLTRLFTSHGFKPTSVRIIKNKDGYSRGLEQ